MSEHAPIQELSFEQYAAADGVSNSMLKIIRESTPLHLLYEMGHPSEPTPAQRFGELVHTAILQPDLAKWHVKPAGMDMRTKAGKEWAEERQSLPIISTDESNSIEGMKAAVHAHPAASRLLKNASFERSLFVHDSEGTLRKLRPDVLPDGGDYLPDLKTCESAHPDDFAKQIVNYGYLEQAAYYLDGTALIGRKFRAFCFIAVEKHPPFAVAVHVLEPAAVGLGRANYEAPLRIYRECKARNEWPGYSAKPQCIELPGFLQRQLEAHA